MEANLNKPLDYIPKVPEELHTQMLKSAIEINDIDTQRYNMIADLENAIATLRKDNWKDDLHYIRENLKDSLERYVKMLKLIDNESRNRQFLKELNELQISQIKTSDIKPEEIKVEPNKSG